jgi:peptidoglycan hydrolase CwlO-like protein
MSTRFRCAPLAIVAVIASLAGACSKSDSQATDRARRDLTKAQTAVSEKRRDVDKGANEIDQRTRDLEVQQRELAAKQTALAADQRELGSAQTSLVAARETFAVAVKVRLAKLDAGLARLAAATDAASIDASTGLRARRERLAAQIAAMPAAATDSWAAHTRDIDLTFDAMERDLEARL